jgi:hypothetical protein
MVQRSYGESGLQVETYTCGSVRVLGIQSEPALRPRLLILVGITLREIPPTESGQFRSAGLSDYQLVDLVGELRFGHGGGGPIIGRLWPKEANLELTSSAYHAESQVFLALDIDNQTLERVEERRSGSVPQFSLTLWPVILKSGKRVRGTVPTLNFELTRELWSEYLASVDYGELEFLEFKRWDIGREGFSGVIDQLRLARHRVERGEYNAAAAAVRTAVEQAIQQTRTAEEDIRAVLSAMTDDERGMRYARMITDLKEVCSRAVHKPEAAVNYSRHEAIFIVRTAESLIALLGGVAATRP